MHSCGNASIANPNRQVNPKISTKGGVDEQRKGRDGALRCPFLAGRSADAAARRPYPRFGIGPGDVDE
jgi:hypothetical protein